MPSTIRTMVQTTRSSDIHSMRFAQVPYIRKSFRDTIDFLQIFNSSDQLQ